MNHPLDLDDPFGSRPDEKPPAGWDARFWEEVRDRIEKTRRSEGPASPIPEPPRGRAATGLAAVSLAVAAALALLAGFGGGPDPSRPENAPTIVRVNGSGDPDVAVEWVRSGGEEAGYVVLTSYDPEISYVLIDRRPRP